MNRAIAWFAKNPVAANLLMVLIIAGGLFAVTRVRMEAFPELSVDMITVTVPYPGAGPEEVEESVCVRIEEAIQDLEGVKRISSSAAENVGSVLVEVAAGRDVRRVMDDVKARVDAIDTLPELAEKPVVQEIVTRNLVANLAVWGDADESVLRAEGERIREELLDLPGITQVEMAGVRPFEIAVEVSEEALRRHGITLGDVTAAVRRSSLDLPGGSLKTERGEILLRTLGRATRGEDIEALALLTRPDGTRILLGDVARVTDGFEETDRAMRFNGKPAVAVRIYKVGDQNMLDVSRTVKDYVARAETSLPGGIALTLWQDNAFMLEGRLDLLTRNAFMGLLLVFGVLALFLRMRLAFWVALGIPISFLGALWVMPQLDLSINMISLFAFILVLGIVVDDAIVVGESIHTEQQRGGDRRRAAVLGTKRVALPVIFAVLTTVAAFLPMAMLPGVMGKYIFVIPVVFIATVLFSLVESMLILPAHLAHGAPRAPGRPGFLTRLQDLFGESLVWMARRFYGPLARMSLRLRYATVALFASVFLLTAGLVAGGRVDFVFFPEMESDFVLAKVFLPQGAAAGDTAAAVKRMEDAVLALRDRMNREAGVDDPSRGVIRQVVASVGVMPISTDAANGAPQPTGSHVGEVAIELAPAEERTLGSVEIGRLWREAVGPMPEAEELSFISQFGTVGRPIDVQLSGQDLGRLKAAATALEGELAAVPGVYGIADSFRLGKREIRLRLKPEAEHLGLSLRDLAGQVRGGFFGEEAQRIQRGPHDVAVVIRYAERERTTLAGLADMRVRTPAGTELPLSAVAEVEFGRTLSSIQRTDRRRTIHVTAQVDGAVGNAERILDGLSTRTLPALLARHPGVKYSLEGEKKEMNESMAGIVRGFLFSLLMIYVLLAVPFKSYAQPLVVMAAIPFGLVGAVWGHLAFGLDLSFMSVMGMVALAGITVNDALVLVDVINRNRRERGGLSLDAVRDAGISRFRPIVLTSLTTVAGLLPMLLEKSVQARFLIPTAVALAFGVVFSTLITLFLVPCGTMILEDLKRALSWALGRAGAAPEPRTADASGEALSAA